MRKQIDGQWVVERNGQVFTEADIKARMADPRNERMADRRDENFMAETRALFRELYPDGSGPADRRH